MARLLSSSLSPEIRRQHEVEILRLFYDEVKSIAKDKFGAAFDQIVELYKNHFVVETFFSLSFIFNAIPIMAQGEGKEKENEENKMLDRVQAALDDSIAYLGL